MFYVLVGSIGSLVLLVAFYYKLVKPVKYWEERDVIHTKSWPLFGSLKNVVLKKKHLIEVLTDIYKQFPSERCVGYMSFTKAFLMIRDLELIKKIGVKDFEYFQDHSSSIVKSDPLLSKSLVSLSGENWRRMRATLSPVFTSNKLKIMYHLIVECAEDLTNHFQEKKLTEIEAKEVFSRFANDVIATTAFGIKINSFNDPTNEFFKMGRHFTEFGFLSILKSIVMELAPGLANLLRIQLFPREVTTFFRSVVKDNITIRENEGIVRPDLIHLLMEARKGHLQDEADGRTEENFAPHIEKNSNQMELTDDDIVAQALVFFFAGFDTVSTASSFLAHELAVHPEVQKKLQTEIDNANKDYNGNVPYEALLSMKYLDQVVSETLRLWPPGFMIERLCVKDYVIEPKNPKEKVVFVEKGISVVLPVMALHRDPNYFDHPDKFDPERFNDENRAKIVAGTYLPFGVGPRNCIGSRFALLEIKILFFHLLSKFILVPVEETVIPLKVSAKKFTMAPEGGFRLALRCRIKSN